MTAPLILLVELVALFIGVSFGVEILQRRFGPERLRGWMGGRPSVAALKGIGLGFATPFCTYSAIPMLVGLRRAGVPPAGYVAFITAAPVLDPILFGALWLIVGPLVATIYVIVTFAAALALALVAQRVGVERHLTPVAAPVQVVTAAPATVPGPAGSPLIDERPGGGCDREVATVEPWRGWSAEARGALRAATALLRSFGPLLLLGVAVGVAIEAVVPPSAAARLTTGHAAIAIPVAAVLGTPLYFSTELFVPIANSLHNAGVGVGAIVALTIAGAGANLPEFVVLSKMATARVIGVFVGFVVTVAMVGGLLAHLVAG